MNNIDCLRFIHEIEIVMKNNSSRGLPAKKTVGSVVRRANPTKVEEQSSSNSASLSNSANKSVNKSSSNNKDKTQSEPVCDICAQNVPGPEREKIYAYGKCDHHVCYVCSARLRAICDQQECPICREKLEDVVFCANKSKLFNNHNLKSYQYDVRYRIYFENDKIRTVFDKLLTFDCLICRENEQSSCTTKENGENSVEPDQESKKPNDPVVKESIKPTKYRFPNVQKLETHLEYRHKLKLCDLCLKHNKLFPFEYSYYTSESLRKHKQFGEDKTPHRGHPKCELCHNNFFNQDELILHMSREHFHCHLCGRHNTTQHIYFMDYESLRNHFKTKHFLCERENCRHEQFTSAFDSEVDYRLHLLQVHEISNNLSRGEARQHRTIVLDAAPLRLSSRSSHHDGPPRNAAIVTTGTPATANDPRRLIPESIRAQIRQQRLPSNSDFPALGNVSRSSSSNLRNVSQQIANSSHPSGNDPLAMPGPSNSAASFVRSAGGRGKPPQQLNEMEFPPLPEQPKKKTGNKSKTSSTKTSKNNREEMALDQLISASLSLSGRAGRNNNGKSGKTNKSTKHRPIKIQL